MPKITNIARDIPQLFHGELQKDEKILWSGRPEPQWFTAADIFFVPFSLAWGGFAYFWEFMVVKMYLDHPHGGPGIFMVLWGVPFCVIGTFMIFGRFFYQHWMQQNTFYAVTNKRVLILNTFRGQKLDALFLDSLPEISKSVNNKGIGSLSFGGDPRMGQIAAINGPFGQRRGVQLPPAFNNVKDVNKVYEIIVKQRKTS